MMDAASQFLFDIENDLRSAVDLSRACFMLMEPPGGLSEQDAGAVLRVVGHLQEHVEAILIIWNAAIAAEQEAALLRPAA